MSGECYLGSQNMQMELLKDAPGDAKENNFPSKNSKNINNLLEYESVVSTAENKCSELKSQLEKIKRLYRNNSELSRSNTSEGLKARIGSSLEAYDKNINLWSRKSKKVRQNSHAIESDFSGAAMNTINNILAGITKPITKSDFFIPNKNDPNISQTTLNEKSQKCCLFGVDDVKINVKSKKSMQKPKSKFNVKKSKSKTSGITSITGCKRAKKSTIRVGLEQKCTKSNDSRLQKLPINKQNSKVPKSRLTVDSSGIDTPRAVLIRKNQDLVEIYHNNAAKESRSSESDMTKQRTNQIEKKELIVDLVPPLPIPSTNVPNNEPQNNSVYVFRNYTKPTISWRMKRVAKYYMNSFNIKCIPFCLSTSTSPSHNIGINIQQVMSMVKNKQPVEKLSPTLAYNIGLAAGKQEEDALPMLDSSFTSKSLHAQCPMTKITTNYQHLQEIAKSIPQDVIQEMDEIEEPNSPEIQSIIITGPSGEVKVKNKKQPVWSADTGGQKCTCVPSKGTTFQQIVNKFNEGSVKIKGHSTQSTCSKNFKDLSVFGSEQYKLSEEPTPLQSKEKKLKEVLQKLHDEFEKLNKTYEDLLKKNGDGDATNPSVTKELEELDKELNSKEEEIIMVMSLYKEVLALKQQVKALKQKTSRDSVSVKSQAIKIKEDNNLATAKLLNKLLQGVQFFQTHYKSR